MLFESCVVLWRQATPHCFVSYDLFANFDLSSIVITSLGKRGVVAHIQQFSY